MIQLILSPYGAEVGSKEALRVLVDAGAEVNRSTEYSGTALISAASIACTDCVEILIKAGADVNAENYCGETVLLIFLTGKTIHKVDLNKRYGIKLLFKSGAHINTKNNLNQNTLERYNFEHERPDKEVLLLLLAAGETIDNSQPAKFGEGGRPSSPLIDLPDCLRENLDDKMHLKRMCKNTICFTEFHNLGCRLH